MKSANNTNKKRVTIIGCGLAGCYFAILLAKRGYTVDIYERFTEEELSGNSFEVRSYNLTFYEWGVQALKEVGVWEKIEPFLVRLAGSIAQIGKNPQVRFPRKDPFFTVQRRMLLHVLVNTARTYPHVTFHFGKSLIAVKRSQQKIVLQDAGTKQYTEVAYEVLIGADGVHSIVRTFLQHDNVVTHKEEQADWEYKQIHIDQAHAKKMQLEEDFMYAWTRKNNFILAHPNIDRSFSALLIMPKNANGFSSLDTPSTIKNFINNMYPDFLPAIDVVIKEIITNPISNFITIYTTPWHYKGEIAVIGDAAHAFNPFYGQGVSAGLADGLTLTELLDKYGSDWETIFEHYQQARKRHTDALATLSKDSIAQHLRQTRADYASIYNQIDTVLYHVFPSFFYPPPYVHVPANPLLADDYLKNHQTQRKRNVFLGLPIFAGIATGIIALYEAFAPQKKK